MMRLKEERDWVRGKVSTSSGQVCSLKRSRFKAGELEQFFVQIINSEEFVLEGDSKITDFLDNIIFFCPLRIVKD